MAFDPAQDPWGAALLITAALAGLGLVLALVARGSGRSATFGGWTMGVGLVGFLGSAVAGAVVRVEAGIASASAAEPGAALDEDEIDDSSAPVDEGDAPSDEDDDEDDDGEKDEDDEDDAEADAAAQAHEAAKPGDPAPSEQAPKATATDPAALPTDPAELRAAVRIILRDAKQVADGKNTCKDPQQLADAWAELSSIPDHAWSSRGNAVLRKLDSCRRTLVWTTLYVVRHERVKQRADFVNVLDERLQSSGKGAAVSVHERNNGRIRIGSQSIAHDEFGRMLDGGLRKELEGLGFERVTFSDGSRADTISLEPVPDQQVANARLEPYGLLARFAR